MAGQGFALLTPLLWKGDVAAGRLAVPFPDRVSARGWAYWLVYPGRAASWCRRSSASANGCLPEMETVEGRRLTAAGHREAAAQAAE